MWDHSNCGVKRRQTKVIIFNCSMKNETQQLRSGTLTHFTTQATCKIIWFLKQHQIHVKLNVGSNSKVWWVCTKIKLFKKQFKKALGNTLKKTQIDIRPCPIFNYKQNSVNTSMDTQVAFIEKPQLKIIDF